MNKLPEIKMSKFKPIKYYESDITCPDDCVAMVTKVGRQVITEDQYFNIGFNYILQHAIDNKFELTSVMKKKKNK